MVTPARIGWSGEPGARSIARQHVVGMMAGVMAAEDVGIERFPFDVARGCLAAGVEGVAGRADADERFA